MTAIAGTDRRAELLDRLLRKRRQQQQENDQISAGPWSEPAPLSSQQAGLWLDSELASNSASYNMISVMRLRGPVDAGLLRAALAGLVARHEALRTSFVEQDGVPRQQVDPPPGRLWFEQLDVSDVPDPSRAQRALQLVTHSCRQRIELDRAPLLRVFLARIDAEDQLLGYVLHHIVSDGWSMPILAREFSELYRAAAEDRPAQLAPQPIQPSDVYRWQHDRLSNAAVQHRLDDWRAQLAGLPPLRLPLDRPRPAVAGSDGRKAELELPADLVARADELARSTGRTPFAVLLAAFAVLLQQRSGQYDLAIGSVFSGRVRTEMESLIGYFANTGVLRIRTAADQPLDRFIGHCHEVLLDAQRMQDIPFPDVVNAIAPARTPGTNPLFQVCFTLARGGVTLAPLAIDGVDVQLIDVEPQGSRFDLTCQLTELLDGSYVMKLEYAGELFDKSSVLRLAADYRSLLRVLLTDPAGAAVTVGGLQQAAALGAEASPDTEQSSPLPVDAPVVAPGRADGESLRDAVARLWAEVFEVTESFTDDQNFFEVGGNSLTAVRLRARIVSEFGVDIPLADIFAGGSVAELLPYLEAGLTGPVGAPALDTQ